jgi:hypothetical protein
VLVNPSGPTAGFTRHRRLPTAETGPASPTLEEKAVVEAGSAAASEGAGEKDLGLAPTVAAAGVVAAGVAAAGAAATAAVAAAAAGHWQPRELTHWIRNVRLE